MANLSIEKLNKVYGKDVHAVIDFNLEIQDKEFIVLVGPSGCGKSTTLRMIAGLEEISDGSLYFDGQLMNDVPSRDRDIAMVFQNYALYPHMTVYENMAFALKMRKYKKGEIDERVKNAAAILGLEPYLTRKPSDISGGQRQRVALGRAIVREPKVFLMDEPLSNLDAKLRVATRAEIVQLHNKLNATFVYVTHDQTEAMTMGTRIVVMKDGVIQQVDTPSNLYKKPLNKFVAEFIGSPQMNFFEAVVRDGCFTFGGMTFSTGVSCGMERVIAGIRPEDISLAGCTEDAFEAEVNLFENLGSHTFLFFKVRGEGTSYIAQLGCDDEFRPGDVVRLTLNPEKIHFFDLQSEERIGE